MIAEFISRSFRKSSPLRANEWTSSAPIDENASQPADAKAGIFNSMRSGFKRNAGGYPRPNTLRLPLVVALGFATVIGFAAFQATKPTPTSPSRLERVPNMDATPGGERQQESRRYRETLHSSNLAQADEADRLGDSFLAVPEALPERTDQQTPLVLSVDEGKNSTDLEESKLPVAEQIAAATYTEAQQTQIRQVKSNTMVAATETDISPNSSTNTNRSNRMEEYPYRAAILQQMSAVAQTMEISGLRSVELIPDSNGSEMAWAILSNTRSKTIATNTANLLTIAAGTILEGESVTLIDSDLTSPVVVRIEGKPLDGAVLIGRFSASHSTGGISIEFNRLAMPDGREIAVQAIAIDNASLGGAVQGHVDSRLLQRYGPMLISSFVSGFAASASQPSMTVFNTANGFAATSERANIRDSLIAGAGQAANAAAADFESTAPKSPRIRICPNETISVLVLSPISISQPYRNEQ